LGVSSIGKFCHQQNQWVSQPDPKNVLILAAHVFNRRLKNALDEKGKKYGSFNPESVNSFCTVAGG